MPGSSDVQHDPCRFAAALVAVWNSPLGVLRTGVLRTGVLPVVLLLGALHPDVVAAQTVPTNVTVEILSASPIVTPINQPLAEPIRVRIRNTQSGAPVAGVVVDVYVNFTICFPLPPPPPPAPTCEEYFQMLYGGFGLDPDGTTSVQATTDAAGIVTVTGFHSGVITGSYELLVGVYASNNGGQFQSPSPGVLLGVIQGPTQTIAPRTIPAADSRSLMLLAALFALIGLIAAQGGTRGR